MIRQLLAARQRTSVWIPAHAAPFDRDIELAVIDGHDVAAVGYPCRRECDGWKNADDRKPLGIDPTHWRYWWSD